MDMCFFRGILAAGGGHLLLGSDNVGPYCNNIPLAKETKLPRALSAGERECIVARKSSDDSGLFGGFSFGGVRETTFVICEFLGVVVSAEAEDQAAPVSADDRC